MSKQKAIHQNISQATTPAAEGGSAGPPLALLGVTLESVTCAPSYPRITPPCDGRMPDGRRVAIAHNSIIDLAGNVENPVVGGVVYAWCATPLTLIVLDCVRSVLDVYAMSASGWTNVQTVSMTPHMELDCEFPCGVGYVGGGIAVMQTRLQGPPTNRWYDVRSITYSIGPDGLILTGVPPVVGSWVDHGYSPLGFGTGYGPGWVASGNCSINKAVRVWGSGGGTPSEMIDSPLWPNVRFDGRGEGGDVMMTYNTSEGLRHAVGRVMMTPNGPLGVSSVEIEPPLFLLTRLWSLVRTDWWAAPIWNWYAPSSMLSVELWSSDTWPQVRLAATSLIPHPDGGVWRDIAVVGSEGGLIGLYAYAEGKVYWLRVE